ncbi:MAG: AraC family transcriptional regulator [Verrucomicrobiae bacterium]|nr:AraC family transcriptional regulator [Verrucomicrobiae bacterium]MCX7914827.1 AraC family transcriptional regulator [Verrucomicrobiae bacterium]MDW8343521.1 AraC family transcriptional regulator [Verrucomicrobiae bacterium]
MVSEWRQVLRLLRSGHFLRMPDHFMQRERPVDYLIIWVLAGEGWVDSESVRRTMRAGDLCVLLPERPHAYGANPDNPWDIVWAHFDGQWAGWFAQEIRRGGEGAWWVGLGLDAAIRDRWLELVMMHAQSGPDGGIHCDTGLAALLGMIVERVQRAPQRVTTSCGFDAAKLQRYIHEHLREPLTLAQLAAVANLSPAHFTRVFKKQFSVSPMYYVIQKRVALACTLLTETNLAVKQVSAAVGYDDPYYFSRLFHKVTGTTPTDYRAAHRGGMRGAGTRR